MYPLLTLYVMGLAGSMAYFYLDENTPDSYVFTVAPFWFLVFPFKICRVVIKNFITDWKKLIKGNT